jgi:hypothetical protein
LGRDHITAVLGPDGLQESRRAGGQDSAAPLGRAAARLTPAVTASGVNGHARLAAGPFNWDADLPPAIGGENLASSRRPTCWALAVCGVLFINDTLAPQLGVQINDVRCVARCVSDLRGLLAFDGVPAEFDEISVELHLVSPEPPERLDLLYPAWLERCPIYLAIISRTTSIRR